MKQIELAKKPCISKSYLNMILKGRRQLALQLIDKL